MTGKSEEVNTHCHKYYPIRPKILNSITMTMVIITHIHIYRVSTKEFHTIKMIQKTNAAYLELHTYTSR
jgi:hypothetical protein